MASFTLNGEPVSVEVSPQTPLLWVLRDHLGMTGTKFGCGIAQCGACTVHLDGEATRTCVLPVSAAEGAEIVTIEGLSADDDHPLQLAWRELQVPQCGYCQSGQIMQAADFLSRNADPSDAEVTEAMAGNLCRCMAYRRIHRAVKRAAEISQAREADMAGVGVFDPARSEEVTHGQV
ncbi:(2Fe-2S)-binding protein [Halomonas denitrificans]|uniref:(2Fe-2S)-binding protein n=1 Tax=Halomonas denitrificans TaxID=370769 RepID=UPI001473CE03|nr:(2Fe-2S)-binding protein [Halomonas denitrificans]